jgi:hypothetical protein
MHLIYVISLMPDRCAVFYDLMETPIHTDI